MSCIIVDHRESKSSVPFLLKKMGIEIEFKLLEIGDYIISPEIAVERKTLQDFVSSLFDGRLFYQIDNLTSSYPFPFLVIEGEYKNLECLIENPKAVYGALVSLLLNYKVNLINVPSEEETAFILSSLAGQFSRKPSYPIKHVKKSNFFDQQVYVVSSLPFVGRAIATRLLDAFGSPKNVFLASVDELARIKGLGKKRARKIRVTLDTSWKNHVKYFENISK
ncbi:MAG: ERCC4 domain-containing protein [Nitrososphaeria archaeon]